MFLLMLPCQKHTMFNSRLFVYAVFVAALDFTRDSWSCTAAALVFALCYDAFAFSSHMFVALSLMVLYHARCAALRRGEWYGTKRATFS
jgi:hypothetical protein